MREKPSLPEEIMKIANELRESGGIREQTFESIQEAMKPQLTRLKQESESKKGSDTNK